MLNFQAECLLKSTITPECARNVIQQSRDLNASAIDQCMDRQLSGDTIPLLDIDKKVIQSLGASVLRPAVLINNFTYRGDLEIEDIFRAICSGYQS